MDSSLIEQEVDVIICGGGTAGCVFAGRLATARPDLSILLIECGPSNKDMESVYTPAMCLSHLAADSPTTLSYTAEDEQALAGRKSVVLTGGVLGGGSSINFMMYTRASASDYDDWETPGWSSKDLIPLLTKMETYHGEPEAPTHGYDGPLHVSYGGHRSNLGTEWLEVVRDYAKVPVPSDLQDLSIGHGVNYWLKWINPVTGRRSDAASGYVHPLLDSPSNTKFRVQVNSRVVRVLFDDANRAIGVQYVTRPTEGGESNPTTPVVLTVKARKLVVVSAGALGSPLILERSGIGRKDVLERAGVTPIVGDLQVGEGYMDHQLNSHHYAASEESETQYSMLKGDVLAHAKASEAFKGGKGILASNAIDASAKLRPTPEQLRAMGPAFEARWSDFFANSPDKPVVFSVFAAAFLGDPSTAPVGKYFTIGSFLTYPCSVGSIHITGPSVADPPRFVTGFLSNEADLPPHVWAYKSNREVARRLPSYRGEVASSHPAFSATSRARCLSAEEAAEVSKAEVEDLVYSEEDDKAIIDWIRSNVATTWHSMATCPMKARDKGGVVDERLNVYGTKSLKVVDLSICPGNVGANPCSTALLVGEKAAQLALEDLSM